MLELSVLCNLKTKGKRKNIKVWRDAGVEKNKIN